MDHVHLELEQNTETSLIEVRATTESGTFPLHAYKFKRDVSAEMWYEGVQRLLDMNLGSLALERRMDKMAEREGLPATWSPEYIFLKAACDIRKAVKGKEKQS